MNMLQRFLGATLMSLTLGVGAETIIPSVPTEPGKKVEATLYAPQAGTYRLTLRPTGQAPSDADPYTEVPLELYQSETLDDLVAAISSGASGSKYVEVSGPAEPVIAVTERSSGSPLSVFQTAAAASGAYRAAAAGAGKVLFYSLEDYAVSIDWKLYDATGRLKASSSANYESKTVQELSDSSLFGASFSAGDTVEATANGRVVLVLSGSDGKSAAFAAYTAPTLTDAAEYTEAAFPQKGGTAFLDVGDDAQLRDEFSELLSSYSSLSADQIRNAAAMTKKKPGKLQQIPTPGTAYKVFSAPGVLSVAVKAKKNAVKEAGLYNAVFASSLLFNEENGTRPNYASKTPGQ